MTSKQKPILLFLAHSCLIHWASAAAAEVRYVDGQALGENNGSNWENAYTSLQDALTAARDSGGWVTELWVRAGVYHPAPPGGDRQVAFELVDALAIYGGFAGTETLLQQRDTGLNITILSGDLNGDDGTNFTHRTDNSIHVVQSYLVDDTASLDGFVVSGGYAEADNGGGMKIQYLGPNIVSCVFCENYASYDGGGLYLASVTSGGIRDCLFIGNQATHNGGGIGSLFSTYSVQRCTFVNNLAGLNNGGGIYNQFGNPTIANCIFFGNHADADVGDGGGLFNLGGVGLIYNCLFSGNTAAGAVSEGGAVQVYVGTATLNHCTFVGNHAGRYAGGYYGFQSNSTLSNCIFLSNSDIGDNDEAAQLDGSDGSLIVNYNNIQGWSGKLGGVGNIGGDPLLVDADGSDNVMGTQDDDVRLSPASPCIDSGDTDSVPNDLTDLDGDGDVGEKWPVDLDDLSRIVDDLATPDTGNSGALGVVTDMGAYEFPGHSQRCDGDANGDEIVDPLDVGFVQARLGCVVVEGDPGCSDSDVNEDGLVDPLDAGYVLARMGPCG